APRPRPPPGPRRGARRRRPRPRRPLPPPDPGRAPDPHPRRRPDELLEPRPHHASRHLRAWGARRLRRRPLEMGADGPRRPLRRRLGRPLRPRRRPRHRPRRRPPLARPQRAAAAPRHAPGLPRRRRLVLHLPLPPEAARRPRRQAPPPRPRRLAPRPHRRRPRLAPLDPRRPTRPRPLGRRPPPAHLLARAAGVKTALHPLHIPRSSGPGGGLGRTTPLVPLIPATAKRRRAAAKAGTQAGLAATQSSPVLRVRVFRVVRGQSCDPRGGSASRNESTNDTKSTNGISSTW